MDPGAQMQQMMAGLGLADPQGLSALAADPSARVGMR